MTRPFPRYGGETAMMEAVGHDTKVNFRVNVMFCLCLWCPNGVLLTKTRIRYIKAAVFQMPYIQVWTPRPHRFEKPMYSPRNHGTYPYEGYKL